MAFLCDSWQMTKSPWASLSVCKLTPLGPAALRESWGEAIYCCVFINWGAFLLDKAPRQSHNTNPEIKQADYLK